MIELKNIYKSYDEQSVLKDINITFEKGRLCMLLGPSGCGKSTMLRLINRLIEPDSGEIRIQGELSSDMKAEELRRRIGYAIQGVGLFPHMTVRENIAVVPKLLKWDKDRIEKRVDELMALMGIPPEYGSKKPSMLSGGEAQRIGVARALGADPDILLMDEPFGALDPVTRRRLQQEFVSLQKKLHKTVIFVTHDISEAVRMADDLVLINDGRILSSGPPESMAKHSEELTRSFFGEQFTLELLAKYTMDQYPMLLEGAEMMGNSLNGESENVLESHVTFREVIAHMLRHGETQVGIRKGDAIYPVTFGDLVSVFGGGTNG